LPSSEKVHIIGVGDDGLEGLTAAARQLVAEAQLLLGTRQTLAAVGSAASGADRVPVDGALERLVQQVSANSQRRVVILTSGDPLFYGVARYLCDKLGKDRFEVVPHVSSMQLAFARVKESWDEAYLANLATVGLERVLDKLRSVEKAGLFTSDAVPPSAVARALLDRKSDYFSAYVCENLGSPDERVTQGDLEDVASHDFSPLNVLILVRKPNAPDRPVEQIGHRLFGNPDEMFLQSQPKRGLLTPLEVRVIALAELDLGPHSVVWDVGAGSGSVAIEAAMIAASGSVYAIEMDPEDHQLIVANAERMGAANLMPVLGQAPDAWEGLPAPDAVFIGGTGRTVSRIVQLAIERLRPRGRLVANVSSIENLAAVHEVVQHGLGDASVRMISIAHATDQLERVVFEARNPTFLISGVRRG